MDEGQKRGEFITVEHLQQCDAVGLLAQPDRKREAMSEEGASG